MIELNSGRLSVAPMIWKYFNKTLDLSLLVATLYSFIRRWRHCSLTHCYVTIGF